MTARFYAFTALGLGAALLVSTAEYLAIHGEMRPNRILSWSVLGVSRHPGRGASTHRLMAALLDHRPFTAILVLQALAAAAMAALALGGIVSAPIQAVIVGTLLLVSYRNAYALEGADQMMLVVAVALFCHAIAPASALVPSVGLWFIALQSALSYLTSGVSKLATPSWRSGEALSLVMNTEAYGTPTAAAILQGRPWLARALCWNVIAVESLFPLALVLGPPYGVVFLAWGVAFHAFNVLVMGLHRFFWAFLATYPAIWFCMTERWGS